MLLRLIERQQIGQALNLVDEQRIEFSPRGDECRRSLPSQRDLNGNTTPVNTRKINNATASDSNAPRIRQAKIVTKTAAMGGTTTRT